MESPITNCVITMGKFKKSKHKFSLVSDETVIRDLVGYLFMDCVTTRLQTEIGSGFSVLDLEKCK